jgi:hypothetical protein
MHQLRAVGLRLAIFGTLGGGLYGMFAWSRRRRLTSADIARMSPEQFRAHIHVIGLESQVKSALSRIDRDPT